MTTKINIIHNLRECNIRLYKNLSYIICLNCNKKNYYIDECFEYKKNYDIAKD